VNLVFAGDSITDSDRRTDPLGLGGGYVGLAAGLLRERGEQHRVVNAGVSGDRVEHLLERWQRDVLDRRPDVLTVYIGVNDTLTTFSRGRPTPRDAFAARYAELLDRAAAAAVERLIVLEPFLVACTEEGAPWRDGTEFARADLDTKRPVVRDLAGRHGADLVPLQEIADAEVARRGPAVVAPDGVHPSAHGHLLIARHWLAAYDRAAVRPRDH
jgi:lysophospholipase L1-like esterase